MLVYLLSGLSFSEAVCALDKLQLNIVDSEIVGNTVCLLNCCLLITSGLHLTHGVKFSTNRWLAIEQSCCLECHILASLASLGKIGMFSFSDIFPFLTLSRLFLVFVWGNQCPLCFVSSLWKCGQHWNGRKSKPAQLQKWPFFQMTTR